MWRNSKQRSFKRQAACKCGHPQSLWHNEHGCRAKNCACQKFDRIALPSKYNAIRTECQSEHSHRSKLEAKECDNLRFRKLAGDIKDYKVEVRTPIYAGKIFLWTYICDFVVEHNDGSKEYREAKGLVFGRFKKSWAFLQEMHKDDSNIRFTIVTKNG
jgi:hypothetical protein